MIMFVAYEIVNRPKHFMCAQLTLSPEMELLSVESDFSATSQPDVCSAQTVVQLLSHVPVW